MKLPKCHQRLSPDTHTSQTSTELQAFKLPMHPSAVRSQYTPQHPHRWPVINPDQGQCALSPGLSIWGMSLWLREWPSHVPWLSGRSVPHYPRLAPIDTLGPCYFWKSSKQKGSSHSDRKKQHELAQMTDRRSPVRVVCWYNPR